MRGRRNPNKPPPSRALPPCRVCGEPSSGHHYGVVTCTACKGFFRRSFLREDSYVCMRNSLCEVGPSTKRRQSCPKCRYTKCLAVGMSREACRMGRYSIENKSKHWTETSLVDVQSTPVNEATARSPNDIQQSEDENSSGSEPPSPLMSMSELHKDVTEIEASNELFKQEPKHGASTEIDLKKNALLSHYLKRSNNNAIQGVSRSKSKIFSSDNDIDGHCFMDVDTTVHSDSSKGQNISRVSNIVISANQERGEFCATTTITPSVTKFKHSLQNSNIPIGNCSSSCDRIPGQRSISQLENIACQNIQFCEISQQNIDPHISARHMTTHIDLRLPQTFSDFCSSQVSGKDSFNNIILNDTLDSGENYDTKPSQSDEGQDYSILSNSSTSFLSEYCNNPFTDDLASRTSSMTPEISTTTRVANATQSDTKIVQGGQASKFNIFGRSSSTRQIDPNSNHLKDFQFLKRSNYINKKSPSSLLLFTPSTLPLSLSIFKEFPFRCFERHLLSPLLKHVYTEDDDMDCFDTPVPHGTLREHFIRNAQENYHQTRVKPPFKPISITLSLNTSDDTSLLEQTFSYDAPEMDNLLEVVRYLNLHHFGPESISLSKNVVSLFMEMYGKICEIQEKLHGKVDFVDDDKFYTILERTGIDVDRRREGYSTNFGEYDSNISKEIKFFRSLPGFKSLGIHDRVLLTKSNVIVYEFLKNIRTIDFSNDVCFQLKEGVAYRASTALRVFPGTRGIMEALTDFYYALKAMDLTDDELILLKAYVVITPDFCEDQLEEPHLVRQWSRVYLSCLLHHLRKVLGPVLGGMRFKKFLDVVRMVKGSVKPIRKVYQAMKTQLIPMTEGLSQQRLVKEMMITL